MYIQSKMEYNFREISAQKSVSLEDFTRGLIDFNFSIGAPSVFVPRKSYFRATLKVTGKDGLTLKGSDGLALSDDCCGSLFNNAYFRIGGNDVSVVNNYVAQCSILKQRLGRANAWAKSVGLSTQMLESDFAKRFSKTTFAPILENNKKVIVPIADDVKSTVDIKVSRDARIVTGLNGTTFRNTLFNQGCTNIANADIKNASIVIDGLVFPILTCADNDELTVDTTSGTTQAPTANCYFICESPMVGDAKNTLDLVFQPPLGIFDLASSSLADEVLVGDFRISLNPNTNYQSSVIECLRRGAQQQEANRLLLPAFPIDPSFYKVSVVDIKFYACYCKMPMEPSFTKQISLSELMVMSKPLSGASNTYEFSVPSSTTALAVWMQSSAMGNNPMYPPSRFKMLNDYQNTLKGIQITYANQSKPSTKWTSNYNDPTTVGNTNPEAINQLVQRYHDNMNENGLLYNPAGAESLPDFLNRGLYILFSFQKDANDRSTQVQLSLDMGTVETNASVYLCAIYDRQTEYTIANGSVASVRQSN